MYDPKIGRLLSCSLDRPRLKKDAIPLLLSGRPKYLSSQETCRREDPEDHRCRLENSLLQAALEGSRRSCEALMKQISISTLEELKDKIDGCEMHSDWIKIWRNEYLLLILINSDRFPELCVTVLLIMTLFVQSFYNVILQIGMVFIVIIICTFKLVPIPLCQSPITQQGLII